MMVIAVGWQVYHLTGRVLDLGLIGLSQFLPFLCLALFAGHAADVHERRVIIMLCFTALPPAPPRTGDQLWPTTAAPPANAAAAGWSRPASNGPMAPFANSRRPTAMSGPVPATA